MRAAQKVLQHFIHFSQNQQEISEHFFCTYSVTARLVLPCLRICFSHACAEGTENGVVW